MHSIFLFLIRAGGPACIVFFLFLVQVIFLHLIVKHSFFIIFIFYLVLSGNDVGVPP